MSFIEIKGIQSYYEVSGTGKQDVVLLHGWGQNTQMMSAIMLHLSKDFRVFNFDFPNFGKSSALTNSWSVADFSEWLEDILEALDVKKPIIIAHSFGCRVALKYALKQPVKKMVLTGAAGIRAKLSFWAKLKIFNYKCIKNILVFLKQDQLLKKLQQNVGSSDYRQASSFLKESFVKIVNEDLSSILPMINVETLLVFGSNDDATPLWMGKKMEKLLPNAALVVFENDDHYAYFHQAHRFNMVLDAFLKEDRL